MGVGGGISILAGGCGCDDFHTGGAVSGLAEIAGGLVQDLYTGL